MFPLTSPVQHERAVFIGNHPCAFCLFTFATNSELEKHALQKQHSSFQCICGSSFNRASCLTRHIKSYMGPHHQCSWCDTKTFPRLDKLRDHLRDFHKFNARSLEKLDPRTLSVPGCEFEPDTSSPDDAATTPAPYQNGLSGFELDPDLQALSLGSGVDNN